MGSRATFQECLGFDLRPSPLKGDVEIVDGVSVWTSNHPLKADVEIVDR